MTKRYIPVLSIAGSDSCGGAGIQADLKTMAALGCYGMTAITAITVQNTTGVSAVEGVASAIVAAQIDAVCSDIMPLAVKTGMLYSADTVEAVATAIGTHCRDNVVVDPVMVSTSGSILLKGDDVVERFARLMFPLATLLTPNVHEARVFTGTGDISEQIKRFHQMGCLNLLLKGGDAECDEAGCKVDILSLDYGRSVERLTSPAIDTPNTHGTGCTLSSAIACRLACGDGLADAVKGARSYIYNAIKAGADVTTGSGHGPVNHFYNPVAQIINDI